MESIIKISQLLLSLSILVVLHELGHFLPAKWFNTRVTKFFLFFDYPRKLWSKQVGETEYGVGMLPLGGYVKIAGMVDETGDTESEQTPPERQFRYKKAWQRLIIMIGGVTVNFLLGIFLFGMILWVWGRKYLPNTELKYGVAMDSVMIRNGFQHGDLVLKIGNTSFDRLDPVGLVKSVALENASTATVMRAGQEVNIQLPADFSNQITSSKKKLLMVPRTPFEIDSVPPRTDDFQTQLQKGDKIIAIDGTPAEWYDQIKHLANQKKGQKIEVGIVRGGDTLQVTHQLDANGLFGVFTATPAKYYAFATQNFTFLEAMPEGWRDAVGFLNDQLAAFGQMFKGKIKVQDNLGSLISIGSMFAPKWEWESFWTLTASLSIILAFMNLLPIPALDGGYVVFLIWEVITGRRVSDSFMEKAVSVGFFLLLGLMVFAFGLDIWRNFIR